MQRTRKLIAVSVIAVGMTLAGYAIGEAQTNSSTFYSCASNGELVGKVSVDNAPNCTGNKTLVSWSNAAPPPLGSAGPTTQVIPGMSSFGRGVCGDTWFFIEDNCGSDVDIARAFSFPIDGSDYPASATFTIEVNLFNSTAFTNQSCYRLVDLDSNVPVVGSEHCIAVPPANVVADFQNNIQGEPSVVEFRSQPFVLPAGDHAYAVQNRTVGFTPQFGGTEGPYGASGVRVRADWTN